MKLATDNRAMAMACVLAGVGLASAQAIIMLAITIFLARLYIRFFYREVN